MFANRYARGYADGVAAAVAALETLSKTNVMLQAQLNERERLLREVIERADRSADRLLAIYGARAVSAAGQVDEARRADEDRALRAVLNLDNFEDVPFSSAEGSYKTADDAAIGARDAERA